jgi:predicted CopG family antitoxin
MNMAHKTLTISEEAYTLLAELKKKGESFTDVILRMGKKARKKPLHEFAGRLKDRKFEEAAREIRRKSFDLDRLKKALVE